MTKEDKFTRVSFPEEVKHRVEDHEVFMSFYDDEYALAFREWWDDEGTVLFQKFCGSRYE